MSVDRSSQRSGGPAAQGPMGRGPMGAGWGAMGRPTEKAKNFKGTVRRFLGYFMPQKYRLIAIIVATIISTSFTIIGPKILGMATTRLFENLQDGLKAISERSC
jgi:ATP-binding cassette subfamily B multidrug efflux pump